MSDPQKNIGRCIGPDITADLVLVFSQIDAYKRLEKRRFTLMLKSLRADTDGEQAAQGPAAEARPTLSQRQPAAEE